MSFNTPSSTERSPIVLQDQRRSSGADQRLRVQEDDLSWIRLLNAHKAGPRLEQDSATQLARLQNLPSFYLDTIMRPRQVLLNLSKALARDLEVFV
jgi:hypothetical protein